MSELPKIVRERLAHAPAGPHPDPDQLTAFAEHSLTAPERAQVLAHLSACAGCREVVALAAPPQTADSALAAQPARGWFTWRAMRWSGMVAAVLLIAAVALVFEQQWKEPELAVVSEVPRPREVAQQAEPDDAAKNERSAASKPAPAPEQPQREYRDQQRKDQPAGRESADAATLGGKVPATEIAEESRLGGKRAVTSGSGAQAAKLDGPAVAIRDEAQRSAGGAAGELKKEKDARTNDFELATAPAAQSAEAQSANAEMRAQAAAPPPPPPAAADKVTASEVAAVETKAKTAQPPAADEITLRRGRAMAYSADHTRWRVTASGTVERSADGRNWSVALLTPRADRYTVVTTLGNHIWAGGTNGLLRVSNDNGRTWTARRLSLAEDVTSIELTGAQTATVHTTKGSYTTTDAGATWTRAKSEPIPQ